MQSWIWHNIHVAVPDDWEMLRFARNAEQGRCVFADRYRVRLELSWRKGKTPPDFDRMMRDYMARLSENGTGASHGLKRADGAGWHGLEGCQGEMLHSRHGRYLPALSYLVEAVMFWPLGVDEALQRDILASVRPEPLTAERWQHWRAFGMDFLTPADLALQSCTVQPASVRMRFSLPGPDRRHAEYERHGLLRHWFDGNLQAWLAKRGGAAWRIESSTNRERAGHTIQHLVGRRRRNGLSLPGRRRLRVRMSAWLCPHDERLYAVTQELPLRDDDAASARALRLCCCPALEPEP